MIKHLAPCLYSVCYFSSSTSKISGRYDERVAYTPDGRKLSSQHLAFMPNGNGSYRLVSATDLYIDGLVLRGGKPLMWRLSAKGQG